MRPGKEPSPQHIPVMVSEVLSYLNIHPNGIYLDGTIGSGGHTRYILSRLDPKGKLIGLDRDMEALDICKKTFYASTSQVFLYQASYDTIPDILQQSDLSVVNGILLDLGLSSLQLNSEKRGFSYMSDGPLDMRFDPAVSITAAQLIRNVNEDGLAAIIRQYGEERHAKRIARYIKKAKSMVTVSHLKEAIRRCTPPAHRNRTFARVFQALRIAVNQELDRLLKFLELFVDYLTIGGRIVIISYHSLEDRPVKQVFKRLEREERISILTKKPSIPSEKESQSNPRARSAKLRAAERII